MRSCFAGRPVRREDGTAGWVDADLALEEAAAGASRMTLELETTGGDPSVHAAWAWPEVA